MEPTKKMLTSIRKITPQDKRPNMSQRLQGKNDSEGPQGEITKPAIVLAAFLSGCAVSTNQEESPDAGVGKDPNPDTSLVEVGSIDTDSDTDTGGCEETEVLEPDTLVKNHNISDTAEFSDEGVPLPPSDNYLQEIWADSETAEFYEDDGNPSEENPGTLRITFDHEEFGGIPRTSPATGQSIIRRIVEIEFNGKLSYLVSFHDNSEFPNISSKANIGEPRSSDTLYVGDTIPLPTGYYFVVDSVTAPEYMDNVVLNLRLFSPNDIEVMGDYSLIEGSVNSIALPNFEVYQIHMHQGSEETEDSPAWAYVSLYDKFHWLVDGEVHEESGATVKLEFGTALVSTPEGEEETEVLQAIELSVPACIDE
jgi:hypothetical protein